MGFLRKVAQWLRRRNQAINLLFVGLDNAGKTTIINALKKSSDDAKDIVPTLGYGKEMLVYSKASLAIHDMSGQSKYRDMWQSFCSDCDAIVFVLDSSDQIRVPVAREELENLLSHPSIKKRRDLPVLVFANKRDVRSSMSAAKCAQALALNVGNWAQSKDSPGRPWYICPSNALKGEGLDDGMGWIMEQLRSQKT